MGVRATGRPATLRRADEEPGKPQLLKDFCHSAEPGNPGQDRCRSISKPAAVVGSIYQRAGLPYRDRVDRALGKAVMKVDGATFKRESDKIQKAIEQAGDSWAGPRKGRA